MAKRKFVITVAVLCCSINVYGQSLELKNIELGASEDTVKKKYSLLTCRDSKDDRYDRTCTLGPQPNAMKDLATLADKPVKNWKFHFLNEKGLAVAEATISSKDFTPVFDALEKKYGLPQSNTEKFLEGGTSLQKYNFMWSAGTRMLIIRGRDKQDFNVVQYFDTELTEKSKKAEERTKKAVKDI